MGYAAEKKKAERKWNKLKLILLVCTLSAVFVGAVLSFFLPSWSWKYRVCLPDVDKRADGELRVNFLDVGQGDATLIELPDGKIALIDGGNGDTATEYALMRYLYALRIDTIDYLIVTHADEDHCGGLDVVLKGLTVKNAYIPLSSAHANKEYEEFYEALTKEENCQVAYAKNGLKMRGENYEFVFLYPFANEVETAIDGNRNFDEDANAYSAVVWLEYNGVGALFTGDLPARQEERLLQAQTLGLLPVDISNTEIIKTGHHGSNDSTSAELLTAIGVKTAVISCGENAYGHPDERLLQRLQTAGVEIYRTDTQGSIVISVQKDSTGYATRALGK